MTEETNTMPNHESLPKRPEPEVSKNTLSVLNIKRGILSVLAPFGFLTATGDAIAQGEQPTNGDTVTSVTDTKAQQRSTAEQQTQQMGAAITGAFRNFEDQAGVLAVRFEDWGTPDIRQGNPENPTQEPLTTTVRAESGANVRSIPSTNSVPLGSLEQGASVTLINNLNEIEQYFETRREGDSLYISINGQEYPITVAPNGALGVSGEWYFTSYNNNLAFINQIGIEGGRANNPLFTVVSTAQPSTESPSTQPPAPDPAPEAPQATAIPVTPAPEAPNPDATTSEPVTPAPDTTAAPAPTPEINREATAPATQAAIERISSQIELTPTQEATVTALAPYLPSEAIGTATYDPETNSLIWTGQTENGNASFRLERVPVQNSEIIIPRILQETGKISGGVIESTNNPYPSISFEMEINTEAPGYFVDPQLNEQTQALEAAGNYLNSHFPNLSQRYSEISIHFVSTKDNLNDWQNGNSRAQFSSGRRVSSSGQELIIEFYWNSTETEPSERALSLQRDFWTAVYAELAVAEHDITESNAPNTTSAANTYEFHGTRSVDGGMEFITAILDAIPDERKQEIRFAKFINVI